MKNLKKILPVALLTVISVPVAVVGAMEATNYIKGTYQELNYDRALARVQRAEQELAEAILDQNLATCALGEWKLSNRYEVTPETLSLCSGLAQEKN